MRCKGVFCVNKVQKDINTEYYKDVEIEEALDISGHGLYNYLILVTSCTIHLGAVMDMLGFSLVVPAASCDLQLSLKENAALTSVSFAGFVFAVPWGYFADTSGRRRALLVSATLGFIFTTLCSFSTNFTTMIVLKFFSCSFSTASLTLTVTYLGECTPKHLRTQFMFVMNCYCLAADFVCYVLAYIILPLEFKITLPWFIFRPWRLLIVLMALPLGIGAFMLAFLPESPKFLANAGATEKSVEVLRRFYRINTGSTNYPIKSIKSTKEDNEPTTFWKSVLSQTVPIFKIPLVWRTLQLFYLLSILCATNNVFFIWFPTLVNSFYNSNPDINESFCQKIVSNISTAQSNTESCNDKTPVNTIYSGIFFTLFFTALNIMIIKLSPWKKTLLIITLIISGISSILVNLIQGSIASIAFFIMIQFTGLCIGIISSYFVDMYPTSYRGMASSFGMMVARFACLGGVNLVGAAVENHCETTFYSWSAFTLSGVAVAMLLPSDQQAKAS